MIDLEAARLRQQAESCIRASAGAWTMFALADFWAAWGRTDSYGKMELCERMLAHQRI